MARGGKLQDVAKMMAEAETVAPIGDAGAARAPAPEVKGKASRFANDDKRGKRGRDEPELPMLPPDCPVIPLGMRRQTYFFLDELGQLIELAADKVAQKGILSMFGRQAHVLRQVWPRYGKPIKNKETGEVEFPVNGWAVDVVSELLMGAAAREGVFDPIGRVRGRGAHRAEDGALILHCGDRVLVGGGVQDGDPEPREARWHEPGKHDGFVYPTGPSCQRPAIAPAPTAAAEQLLALFGTWRWTRLDRPGAADRLHRRGDAGRGAALAADGVDHGRQLDRQIDAGRQLLELLFAGDLLPADGCGPRPACASCSATTRCRSRSTSSRARRTIGASWRSSSSARMASSGGRGVRGRAGSQGARILDPIVLPVLLDPVAAAAAAGSQPAGRARAQAARQTRQAAGACGRAAQILWGQDFRPAAGRRMVALRGDARALSARAGRGRPWRAIGPINSARCWRARICCCSTSPTRDDRTGDYARALDARHLAEKAEDASDSERCARHISSSILPPMSGETPRDIASWCLEMLEGSRQVKAKERLAAIGLRVLRATRKADEEGEARWSTGDPPVPAEGYFSGNTAELYLAVASEHVGLAPLFRQSHWASRAGAASPWAQTLRRLELAGEVGPIGAIANQKIRIGGQLRSATLVPLGAIADLSAAGRMAA